MDSALLIHRLQFAFTITYHYLFPQLTMGLAPLIVVLKTIELKTGDERYGAAARFWAKIFGINFVIGVVTGIPMEFQFGTNWSHFSRVTGGVIGQPLVMEGVFSFFLESAFLGLFLYGEKRLSPKAHWWSAFLVFCGSWLSGYFIIVTDAWMQHPVAYERAADGSFQVVSFWGLLMNPWALLQYAHNMSGAAITGSFVMAAVGAYYLLEGKFTEHARVFVRVGVIAGFIFSALQIFPTGDLHGLKPNARYAVFHGADNLDGEESKGGEQSPGQYYESIDLVDAFHPQTIMAYAMNGQNLAVPHGAPLRLRVERQLGYKHAKYVQHIQIVDSLSGIAGGRGGYWEDRGYEWYAGI